MYNCPAPFFSTIHNWRFSGFDPVPSAAVLPRVHAPTACVSCAAPSDLPPRTAGSPASRSPRSLCGSTTHATAAGSRSAASAAPASPTRLATPHCGPAAAHTDSSTAPRPAACRPCVRSDHARPEPTPRLLLDRQAPAVFSDHRLQRLAMQTQLRHQQLQPAVLVFHRLQPLCLAHLHAAELLLPAVERRRADPMLTAQIRRLHASLMLLQYPDDLIFRVPALLHTPSSRLDYERTPASTGRVRWEQVTSSPPACAVPDAKIPPSVSMDTRASRPDPRRSSSRGASQSVRMLWIAARWRNFGKRRPYAGRQVQQSLGGLCGQVPGQSPADCLPSRSVHRQPCPPSAIRKQRAFRDTMEDARFHNRLLHFHILRYGDLLNPLAYLNQLRLPVFGCISRRRRSAHWWRCVRNTPPRKVPLFPSCSARYASLASSTKYSQHTSQVSQS